MGMWNIFVILLLEFLIYAEEFWSFSKKKFLLAEHFHINIYESLVSCEKKLSSKLNIIYEFDTRWVPYGLRLSSAKLRKC